MRIEIVSHCYAGTLPQYAALLHYQLSSLVLHRPEKVEVVHTTVCNPNDELTMRVVMPTLGIQRRINSRVYLQGLPQLFNRAIGRNRVALATRADVVWFCDCDYVFGPGCLDSLEDQVPMYSGEALFYPQHVNIHKTHAIGDERIETRLAAFGRGDFMLSDIRATDFEQRKERKPYGGLFIVSGDYCRKFGWLDNKPEYHKPVEGDMPFPTFREDVAFRRDYQASGLQPWRALDIPNLFRIRHSRTTYQGEEGFSGEKNRASTI